MNGRPCRNAPRCRRTSTADSPYCAEDVARLTLAAFGPAGGRERAHVERLSASMPELQLAGRPERAA